LRIKAIWIFLGPQKGKLANRGITVMICSDRPFWPFLGRSFMKPFLTIALAAAIIILPSNAVAATLEVGPDKNFKTIEYAYQQAKEGDTIVVYPRYGNQPYERSALRVGKKSITFRAAEPGVRISGKGFDYSGEYPVPRAIFQFDKGADNCVVEGFELFNAHNETYNGAGVRINMANNIRITGCDIHDNDMGIMSIGDGTGHTGVNQIIERCRIHDNGLSDSPHFHHNLYLDGESATVSFCEIYKSRRGHNLKSRAHFMLVQYCYVHDSADREFDFVDGKETERPESDAVLIGNIIVKDPGCKGNLQVIYFGQDGKGFRDGTLYLVHNTIVTAFSSPVIMLSSPEAKADLVGNFICDGGNGDGGQSIADAMGSAQLKNVSGEFNVFGRRFAPQAATRLAGTNTFGYGKTFPFKDPRKNDYRPKHPLPYAWPAKLMTLPKLPSPLKYKGKKPISWQYKYPADGEERPYEERLTVGAYSYTGN